MISLIRNHKCNSWRLGAAPFHVAYYLACIMCVVYFFYPNYYLVKASPIWLCCISCLLHNSKWYTFYIAIGLLFGSFGDIFLEMDSTYGVNMFIPGLISFLIGHLFYIRAFFDNPPRSVSLYTALPICCSYYATVMSFLLSKVDSFLIGPVAIYGLVITTMVFYGSNRFVMSDKFHYHTRLFTILGSLAFVSSDTILSFNSFYSHVPSGGNLVMITYYIGQLFICGSSQFDLEEINLDDGDIDKNALLES